jgi:hypothetical protein
MTIMVRGVEIVAITRRRGADCSSRRGRQGWDNIDIGMQLCTKYSNTILNMSISTTHKVVGVGIWYLPSGAVPCNLTP